MADKPFAELKKNKKNYNSSDQEKINNVLTLAFEFRKSFLERNPNLTELKNLRDATVHFRNNNTRKRSDKLYKITGMANGEEFVVSNPTVSIWVITDLERKWSGLEGVFRLHTQTTGNLIEQAEQQGGLSRGQFNDFILNDDREVKFCCDYYLKLAQNYIHTAYNYCGCDFKSLILV